jgi:hypothetical protein
MRGDAKRLAIEAHQHPVCGLTNSCGILQQSLKNRLHVAGRAGDDAQHFRCRRLLLQRLAQIVGALTQLIEQPCVLDGDDGLVGERPEQPALLVRERTGVGPQDAERADGNIAAQHRHGRHRAIAGRQEIARSDCQFRRHVLGVGNIHDPAIENGRARYVRARERQRHSASHCFDARRIGRGDGGSLDLIPVCESNQDGGAGKKLEPACHDGVEHRLGGAE